MDTYLTGDQLHILCTAYRIGKFVSPSQLFTRSGITVDSVSELYKDGYLSRRKSRYCRNSKTFQAISDHGIDPDELSEIEKPSITVGEKPSEECPVGLGQLQEMFNTPGLRRLIENPQIVSEAILGEAARKAKAGDPWDYIRLQWPEIVIKDSIDLRYFQKHLTRTENFDIRLDDIQYRLIENAFDISIREIGIKGCTSPGKGFATAIVMNTWYSLYDVDRIIVVSTSTKHAQDVMFGEMATWRRKMRFPGGGEILSLGIKEIGNEKHQVVIVNPETGEGLSGRHGQNTLAIIDESTGVPESLLIQLRAQARLIICVSNPRTLSGWFRDLYPATDPDENRIIIDKGIKRSLLTFGGPDCLNVIARRLKYPVGPPGGLDIETIDGERFFVAEGDMIPDELLPHTRELIPNQMDYQKYRTIMQSSDPIVRAWSAEGKFPPEDMDFQIIPPSWLKPCCELWNTSKDTIEVTAFGLDVAHSIDKDETVLAYGGPKGIKGMFRCRKDDSIQTAAWVQACALQLGINLMKGEAPLCVDAIGVGDPFCDLLEDQGMVIIRVKGNKSSDVNPQTYINKRAELFGEFANRINPELSHFEPYMVPDDQGLKDELVAHEKIVSPDGQKWQVTPKRNAYSGRLAAVQSITRKLGRSPDAADAVLLCYAAVAEYETDSHVISQFDPTKYLYSAESRTSRGETIVEVQDGAGNTDKMNESEFISTWGDDPQLIELEVRAFKEALEIANKGPRSDCFF